MATTMTYGAYPLVPVPLMSISKELEKTGDSSSLGELFSISLRGTLTVPTNTGSIITIRQMQDDLMAAFSGDGLLFELKCDSTVLLRAYPRIRSVEFDDGIWVNTSPYTITLDFDEITPGSGTSFVSDASEDWSVEFDDSAKWSWELPNGSGTDANPYRLRVSHSLSATGKKHYSSSGLQKQAWENARDYILPRLGFDNTYLTSSGVLNLNSAIFGQYDHMRTVQVNELAGSYAVTESWFVQSTGTGIPGTAIEDFTVSLRTSAETDLTSVSVEGTIQGVEQRSYGTNPGDFTIIETKYASASGTWGTVKNRVLSRANLLLDTVTTTRDLNVIPLSSNIGHNPNTGSISYSYEFDDRPANCIPGAKSEVISIIDNHPTDVFARLTVLGRAAGPILQDLSTQTESSRELSIEAVMSPATGCPTAGNVAAYFAQRPTAAVDTIVDAIEADLSGNYSQLFKTSDTENWEPKAGRYSRQVSWVFMNCS
jgi:hypothetical protein